MYNYEDPVLPGRELLNNSTVNIKKFILIPTKYTYNEIPQRSFTLNVTNNALSKLTDMTHATYNKTSNKIGDIEVANSLQNIIGINPKATNIVYIPNGWETRRLRFLLETESQLGAVTLVNYIQGFTDYHDPSTSGLIDPATIFYINSITTVSKTFDPVHGFISVRPTATYNVITDLVNGSRYEMVDSGTLHTIRPKDIINNLYFTSEFGGPEHKISVTPEVVNKNTNAASNRLNNNPISYFANTVNAYIDSQNTARNSFNHGDILRQATSLLHDGDISGNPFILELSGRTGKLMPTSFSMGELGILDPNISSKMILIKQNDIGYIESITNTELDTQNTESTLQPTYENMLAVLIANMIPSMALDCLLTEVGFSYTNSSGSNTTLITNANSFVSDMDITPCINKLVSLIDTVLAPIITSNNMSMVELYANVNVMGDTNIMIKVDTGPLINYRFPTFADSLYAPIIADVNQKNMLVNDFENVLDATAIDLHHNLF